MNYIKHLTGFFDRVVPDDRLNPTHISLYLSLFQFWNVNRFQNPISICREEVMRVSKICAKATYHKCMKDLHNYGYVKYIPSYNPFKGSLVHLVVFDPDCEPVQKTDGQQFNKQSGTGTAGRTGTEQALVPSINNINIVNNKNYRDEPNILEKSQALFSENETHGFSENSDSKSTTAENPKRKKVAAKKEKEPENIPSVEATISFFKSENYPEIEARRFFNHFESNGWKVGGKTPMKNWNAAARNWMLNIPKFASKPKLSGNNPTNLNQSKNYGEPL